MGWLTTNEVAERLGVTRRRVLALIADERLPAQKFGRDYKIDERDLKLVADRKAGRPRKQASKQNERTKGNRI
jgi:excisionase family DNA binding protein